jgi:DNA mismatch endonuclease, patch repair protein
LKKRRRKATRTAPTELRSRIMRAIRSKGTKPELIVEGWLRAARYNPRLHSTDLPGTPDFVLPRLKTVVFVHGCFWHGHGCRRGGRAPATNVDYWLPKLARNKQRDASKARRLRSAGWRVFTVWECQTGSDTGRMRLLAKLRANRSYP